MGTYEILDEYVLAQRAAIDRNEPVIVELRNTDSFERLVARALIAPPGRQLADSEGLVLRNMAENVGDQGWSIRVLEELDAENVQSVAVSVFRKDANPNA